METATLWRIGEEAIVNDEKSAYFFHKVRVAEVHGDILLVEKRLTENGVVCFAVHQDNLLESY